MLLRFLTGNHKGGCCLYWGKPRLLTLGRAPEKRREERWEERMGREPAAGRQQKRGRECDESSRAPHFWESCEDVDGVGQRGAKASPPSNPLSECKEQPSRCLTQPELKGAMLEVASTVRNWQDGHYTFVKTLEEAIRNSGSVDLMQGPESAGAAEVAVKRMPNHWVQAGPLEFERKHPHVPERPWVDLGLLRQLSKAACPYACELLGVFRNEQHTFVVTTLATEGDLFNWCARDPAPGPARESSMQPIMVQIFAAVRWLHNFGIAHRDLSPENICIAKGSCSRGVQVKIIDFGMATLSRTCRREIRGKDPYQAPEMSSELGYDTYLADAFSLGVVLFAMAARDYPWASTQRGICKHFSTFSLYGLRYFLGRRQVRGGGERLLEVFSPVLVELLDGLLKLTPSLRMSLGENCFPATRHQGTVWDLCGAGGLGWAISV